MKYLNGNILVEFEPLKLISGLVHPERYLIQEADQSDEANAYGIVTDRRLINPQTVRILSGEYEGQRAFVYYGAYELKKYTEVGFLIPDKTLFFLLDPMRMLPNTYLGEEVFTQGETTASGIYTTPFAEKKEGVKIKLTHVPENSQYVPGETVITIDPYQYPLTYEGKKYIKLTEGQIIGVERGEVVPTNDTILVQYLPDEFLQERLAENDRRKHRRDVMDVGFFVSDIHATHGHAPDWEDLPEPKFVKAKVLAVSEHIPQPVTLDGVEYSGAVGIGQTLGDVDTIWAFRNFGCSLGNDMWIINIDAVVGKIC